MSSIPYAVQEDEFFSFPRRWPGESDVSPKT